MNFKRALLKLYYDKIFYRLARQHNKTKLIMLSLFYKKIFYLFYVIFHTIPNNTRNIELISFCPQKTFENSQYYDFNIQPQRPVSYIGQIILYSSFHLI